MADKEKISKLRTLPEQSRGRLHPSDDCDMRHEFQRDRDRIIHSSAFRRLVYKTQVFVNHEGDLYRTRLTHSLEVAQMARSLCRLMGVTEELAEAIALSHDFGHTPFGHAGEDALNACMKAHGGFDHNAQTIRILTKLERRYARFDGLNLTWETLEGAAKHNGPITGSKVSRALKEYNDLHDLELNTFCGIEGQIAGLSDDIAYNNHDIDDGLRAGFISIEQLREINLIGRFITEVQDKYKGLEDRRVSYEASRRLITFLLNDVFAETVRRAEQEGVENAADVRNASIPIVSFSNEVKQELSGLKNFLMLNVYKHDRVKKMLDEATVTVTKLYNYYADNPDNLPQEWREPSADSNRIAINIADYIAGMTDRFALQTADKIP